MTWKTLNKNVKGLSIRFNEKEVTYKMRLRSQNQKSRPNKQTQQPTKEQGRVQKTKQEGTNKQNNKRRRMVASDSESSKKQKNTEALDPCLNLLEESSSHVSTTHLTRSETFLEEKNYRDATSEADQVLKDIPPLPTLAKAALTRGRALLNQAMDEMSETGEPVKQELFDLVWNAFGLSSRLNPECGETIEEMDKLSEFLKEMPKPESSDDAADYDVLIVGAGCAGVGTALLLTETFGLDKSRVLLVERGEVGESFLRWPEEMRFISPSFNQQGWTDSFDLNSISRDTSPAFSLHTEHPSGKEYASYLRALVKTNELNVRSGTEVESVQAVGEEDGSPLFSVRVRTKAEKEDAAEKPSDTLSARYIIWAAGEFQYPRVSSTEPINEESKEGELNEGINEEEKKDESEEGDKSNELNEDIVDKKKKGAKGILNTEMTASGSSDEEEKDAGLNEYVVVGSTDLEKKDNEVDGSIDEKLQGSTNEEKKDEEVEEMVEETDFLIGAEHCLHNSQVRSWAELPGDEFLIIGGYESGVDACVNLARAGKSSQVLASTPCWNTITADPSAELAPYTAARLRDVTRDSFSPRPQLLAPIRVLMVEKAEDGFNVTAEWLPVEEEEEAPLREPTKVKMNQPGEPGTTLVIHTPNPPILATGFQGSVEATASHLFAFADDDNPRKSCLNGAPLLTEYDESTITKGVFLVGPQVQHDALSFCFVYKFRQRFAVVADAICQGLGKDTKSAVAECRLNNMYLDNFETCQDTCGDVC